MGAQRVPGDGMAVTITREAIWILVVEVENGIETTNTSENAFIVFVSSPDGEQQLELDAGGSVAVTNVTKPTGFLVVEG